MKEIVLTKGYKTIVDDSDYAWLSKVKWHAAERKGLVYALRQHGGKWVRLHNAIMNPPPGLQVDHLNRNPLDNRRSNLRLCTISENMQNQRISPHSSRFKGVSYRKDRACWRAQIRINGKVTHLGNFETEGEAAEAYNEAAKAHYGPLSYLNAL